MIDGLKPYPEYKKSGVSWLSKIPAHWQVVRNGVCSRSEIKQLCASADPRGFAENGYPCPRLREVLRKQVMSDFDKYKRAAKGDLAYNMMRMWQGAVESHRLMA